MATVSKTSGGEIPVDYPPTYHLLRDLGVYVERDAAGSRAGLRVGEPLCSTAGGVRTGVLATLVDVIGGECATRAAAPGWVATCDLVLHHFGAVSSGEVVATPAVLRSGRSTVVVEIALTATEPAPRPVGLATLTFSVLEARGGIQTMDERADAPRTDFAEGAAPLDAPLVDRLGCSTVDAPRGIVELRPSPYVGNSLGAVQGGALAILVDLAAEAAGRAVGDASWVTTDLSIHYLALGRRGPIRTEARLLRAEPSRALLRIAVRDEGADGRLVVAATATVEALDPEA